MYPHRCGVPVCIYRIIMALERAGLLPRHNVGEKRTNTQQELLVSSERLKRLLSCAHIVTHAFPLTQQARVYQSCCNKKNGILKAHQQDLKLLLPREQSSAASFLQRSTYPERSAVLSQQNKKMRARRPGLRFFEINPTKG